MGLLEGLRVIDLSRVLAAPFAAQVMADMGADVIKVESPRGDPARGLGPYLGERSLYFSALNSGKRGIVLDLKHPAGEEALHALVDTADVVIENFRPGAAGRLGLTPQDLLDRHSGLVVVSVTGYAHQTDRAHEGAYDLTVQAEAGIMAVTGEAGRAPVRAGVALADLAAGLWAVIGALAALTARHGDGRGRHVEVPMLDSTLVLLAYVATGAWSTGQEPDRVGSGHQVICPYGAFPTADGWVVVAVLGDKFWPALCRALELDDLSERDDLRTNAGRDAAREEVEGAVGAALGRLSTEEALRRLAEADVPSGPVLSVLDALSTPYVRERELLIDLETAEGTYGLVRGPLASGRRLRPAPALGEHTAEVLAEVLGRDHPAYAEFVPG